MYPNATPTPTTAYAAPPAPAAGTPSFDTFKAALGGFNNAAANVAPQIGAAQAANVLPTFDYQAGVNSKLQANNDELSKLQDLLQGKNYQQVKKADGGFDYFDPLGRKITINQYSQATGKDPVSLLKSSDNSLDRQYIRDWNEMNILTNGTPAEQKKVFDAHPGLQESLKGVPVDQIYKQFIQYYPNIYSDSGQRADYRQETPPGQTPPKNAPQVYTPQPQNVPPNLFHQLLAKLHLGG